MHVGVDLHAWFKLVQWQNNGSHSSMSQQVMSLTDISGMVGDVNLFITDADEPHTAELEVQPHQSAPCSALACAKCRQQTKSA